MCYDVIFIYFRVLEVVKVQKVVKDPLVHVDKLESAEMKGFLEHL